MAGTGEWRPDSKAAACTPPKLSEMCSANMHDQCLRRPVYTCVVCLYYILTGHDCTGTYSAVFECMPAGWVTMVAHRWARTSEPNILRPNSMPWRVIFSFCRLYVYRVSILHHPQVSGVEVLE